MQQASGTLSLESEQSILARALASRGKNPVPAVLRAAVLPRLANCCVHVHSILPQTDRPVALRCLRAQKAARDPSSFG